MNYFDLDFAILLHEDIIHHFGGLKGFHQSSLNLLASALTHIQNDDFYPDLCDKLAHLMFACVKFHPFLDGNKRSAIYLTDRLAALNGVQFDEDFIEKLEFIVVDIAQNDFSKDELKELFKEYLKSF